jgi:hypothetical protein
MTVVYNLVVHPLVLILSLLLSQQVVRLRSLGFRSFQFCELSLRSLSCFFASNFIRSLQPLGRFSILSTAFDWFSSLSLELILFFPGSIINMFSKAFAFVALVAYVEARFGQEQAVANLVQALGNFGQPGQAATLAGQTPGVLLAGANACAKVR